MEEEIKKQEHKKINLSVIGVTDEDIDEVEIEGATAHLLNIDKLKKEKQSESCLIHDQRIGLVVEMSSHKHPCEVVGGLCFNIFKKITNQRKAYHPSYIR